MKRFLYKLIDKANFNSQEEHGDFSFLFSYQQLDAFVPNNW